MPSWPEYSIRIWASSPGMRIFGMDFVESATSTPVNLSHRFHLYGTNIFGTYLPIRPFNFTPNSIHSPPRGPGEELYYLREEQTVLIQDILQPMPVKALRSYEEDSEVNQVAVLRFKVPRHPVDITEPPPGVKYDDMHWSLDN